MSPFFVPGKVVDGHMFPTSLHNEFVTREGEAPAEPLQPWLGRSLALPKI